MSNPTDPNSTTNIIQFPVRGRQAKQVPDTRDAEMDALIKKVLGAFPPDPIPPALTNLEKSVKQINRKLAKISRQLEAIQLSRRDDANS